MYIELINKKIIIKYLFIFIFNISLYVYLFIIYFKKKIENNLWDVKLLQFMQIKY